MTARSLRGWCCALLAALLCECSGAAQVPPLGGDLPQISGPLSLSAAVKIGLNSNLSVQAMRADLSAARADTRTARAMTLPQVSANTFLTVGDMESMLGSSPDVTPAFSRDVPAKGFALQNLSLMVPIYTGGRLSGQVRAASARERAAASGVDNEQAATSLTIKDAYYRALLAAELVKVAQARLDAATGLVQTARALYDAGKGIEAAVSRAISEQSDAQRMLTTARSDEAKMLLDLKTAMGVGLDSAITLSDTLAFAPVAGDVNASLAEAARTRPDIRAARAKAEAAGAQITAAKGSMAPQVYASVMADAFASKQMDSGTGYTAGVTVSFPLFDAGQRRAQVDQSRAARDRAVAELRGAELAAANEVRQAWLDIETASQNYRTAQAALAAAQQAYDVAALRVQNQKAILLEQLDAQAALTQARANVAQALYDHLAAAARQQRAIGRP